MLCCPHCSQLLTILNNIVTPDSGSTILFNIVDKCENSEQRGQHNNSPTTSNSLLSSHVELTNYDPKHVSPVKTSHGDQHKKVDSNAKKSTNIIDHNLPLLDNKRFNPTSPPLKVNLQRSEQQIGQIRRNYFRKRLRKRSRARLSQERENYYYQTSTKTGQNNKVPWFRYHIQRKDPDWIEHLDLVRRITVSQ